MSRLSDIGSTEAAARSNRGRGRPPEGERIEVRLPAAMLDEVDAYAARFRLPRAAAIRHLLAYGLETLP